MEAYQEALALARWRAERIKELEAERDRYRGALEQIVKVQAPKIDEGEIMADIAQQALDG